MLRLPFRAGKALSLPRRSSFERPRAKSRGNPPFTPQQAALSRVAFWCKRAPFPPGMVAVFVR